MALTTSHLQCSMYDQYAYYHYETVEEKPVPKPPQLVSLSDERAARQRRDEKGLCSFYSHFENHLFSFQGCWLLFPQASTKIACYNLLNYELRA